MLIRIGKFDITECWDGVFYKKLSRYPEITAWEIQTVLDFIRYEKDNGRTCTIEADRKIINAIDRYRQTYDQGIRVSPPENDGIIPQKSLTVWDGMGKTRNVQKRESVDIKRSGNMEERRESYNNNFKSCFPHQRALDNQGLFFVRSITVSTVIIFPREGG